MAALFGRRILVVDDNALNREVVGDFLQLAGIAVDSAVNGQDALAKLEAGTYDAVLMDVHMPEMDGLTATRKIRQSERWASLPLIALTAQALTKDREASLAAGMNAHLTKPIDEMALYKTLMDLLPPIATSGAAGTAAQADEADAAYASPPGLDLSAALKRLGGNQARLARLLQGFVRDFREAPLQLDDHLRRRDAQAVAALAHAVRGAGSYLDAHDLCLAAARLEATARRGDVAGLQAFVPHFRSTLTTVLAQLDGLAVGPDHRDGEGGIDAGKVLELIGAAEPLLRDGDYAAYPLLDEIVSHLSGTAEGEWAKQALAYFEELELIEAGAALQQLKADLEQRAPESTRQ